MKKVKKFSQRYLRKGVLIATTITAICGFLIFNGVAFATDTGFKSPTDEGGAWSNANNAYSDGGGAATDSDGDRQRYYDFSFGVPSGSIIDGIEVKVDAWSSDSSGCQIGVDLSWNGGSNWSNEKTQSLTDSETTYTLGSGSDKWSSHNWADSEFSNLNFRARVHDIDPGQNCSGTTSLDWIQVRVTYHAPATYTINASAGAGGTITPSGAVIVNEGANQAFTITPSTGYIVSDVVVDSGSVGRVNSYTFNNVATDHTISASFEDGNWKAPSSFTDSGWTGSGNAYTSDESYSTTNSFNISVKYDDFGFTIPDGATIDGIEVAVEGKTTGRQISVNISQNGTTFGTAKESGSGGIPSFSGTESTILFGNSTAKWGLTGLSATTINSSFRVRIISQILLSPMGTTFSLDQLQVKVYYTLPTGSLTVTKETVGGDGSFDMSGSGGIGAFTIVTSGNTGSQTFNGLIPGSYTITETVPTGWEKTGDDCQDVQVLSGQTATCTITNTQKGHIIVDKVTVPSQDPQSFTFTTIGTGYNGFSLTDADAPNDQMLVPGPYSVSETVPGGWDLTEATCVSSIQDPETIDNLELDAGETITCTFTNTKLGTIIVEKQTIPDGSTGDFNFTGDLAGTVSDGEQLILDVVPGTYTSTENDPVPIFDLTDITCDDDDSSGDGVATATFNVDAGETVTCTFTNTKRGSITVVKVADPEEGSFGFTLTGPTPGETTIGDPYDPYTFIDLLPGGYSLTETLPEGWSGETNIACTDDMDPGQLTLLPGGSITCVFNNTEYGVIGGTKWHDLNADGVYGEEPVLNDWVIYLSGEAEDDTVTNESGFYLFSSLLPGTYQICEGLPGDWYQSFPPIEGFDSIGFDCDGSAGYQFYLPAGETVLSNDFGNYQLGSISGSKWNDLNGNGEWDEGEPALSGWEIKLNDDEPVSTNENGFYQFPGLMPGLYDVSETLQEGWVQTWPVDPPNYVDLVVLSGQDTDNNNFGNFQLAIISGYKWEDRNNDGVWQKEGENTELSLQNWEIKATKGETVKPTTTNENGYYQFTFGPDELGNWTVSETLQESWKQTLPADPGTYAITISQSGQADTEKNFGNIYYYEKLGGKFAATSGDFNSTPSLIVVEDSVITAPAEGGGNSTVSLGEGTVITRGDGENMDGAALTIEALAPGSLTGLATGVVMEGALQWGLEDLGLEFNPAITVSIYVGTGFNGMTLNILRSVSSSGGWTDEGIVPPAACLVADGLCTFQATKASFYGAAFFLALPVPPAGGGGGGGAPAELSISPESIRISELGENRITITWTTSDFSTSQVVYAREGESHTLDLTDTAGTPPKYGYARTTPEYDTLTKVTSHSVTIYDLSPGAVYYYRTVSHGSLAVSQELSFTTQGAALPAEQTIVFSPEAGGVPSGEEGIETPSGEVPAGEEGVIGAPEEVAPGGETGAEGPVTEKETLPETLLGRGLLAAVGTLPFNLKLIIILVLAVIVVLIVLRLFRKKR